MPRYKARFDPIGRGCPPYKHTGTGTWYRSSVGGSLRKEGAGNDQHRTEAEKQEQDKEEQARKKARK